MRSLWTWYGVEGVVPKCIFLHIFAYFCIFLQTKDAASSSRLFFFFFSLVFRSRGFSVFLQTT